MRVPDKSGVETLAIRTFGEVTIALQPRFLAGASGFNLNAGSDTVPDFERVQFATRSVKALLIYLACHRRPLGRDLLAELFWPERSQKQARSNLRVALHRLRQQLAPYLLVTYHSVALNPEIAIDVDVAQFEAHLAAGQLEAAVALYTSDFLDGFYLDGSPAFEQWALLERERLRTLALAAWQQRIGQMTADRQFGAAIAGAQRLLQLDPLHEPTHRQLMRLLAQNDQRTIALAHYETCRHLLAIEIDAPPDETTTALYEQIREGKVDRETRGQESKAPSETHQISVSSPLPISSSHHNLPTQPTPFIGRSTELAQIESLLANPDCRLLTLLGMGGIGKTRLALAAAQRLAEAQFTDDVCFVSLAAVGTAELILVALAQSLGLQSSNDDLQAQIATYLSARSLLLILDNFEHLLDASGKAIDTVAYLLHSAPQLKALVTSRSRLHLREEWLLPVAGLSLAGEVAGEAGQLFLRNAQRVHPSFTSRDQETAIADICRQVEGMPLALELAASWVRIMPCAQIARQMQENFDFLNTALHNLPDRHRSMRTLLDGSWRLLSPVEQGVLRRASLFQGGWTLDEATPITGATLSLLLGLVDKSLVRASGQNRFDLHELVRQYAAEQLVNSDEGDLIRQRHSATYLHLFRTGDSHLREAAAAIWLARLEPEQDNLRAALQWALDAARYVDAAWLMVAANWFWHMCGNRYEQGRWLAQLLPHRHTLAADQRLGILLILYAVAGAWEEFQPVDRWTGEIMQLLEVCSDKLLQAGAWFFFAVYSTDFSQAAVAYERSIAFARAACEGPELGAEFCLMADRDFVLVSCLWEYATDLIELGQIAQAAPLVTESLEIFRRRGNQYEIADGLGTLGILALLQGDLAQAQRHLYEAVDLATLFKHQEILRNWQPLLGLVTLYGGNVPEARQLLSESLHLCLELKSKSVSARVCTYLAETALWVGELEQAEQWLVQSLAYQADPHRITMYEVIRLFVAARLATAQQQYPRAATLFGLADQAHSHIHYVIAGPIHALADAALATVRAALDPLVFAEAFATGQQLSLEEAYATILAPNHVAGSLAAAGLN